MQAVLYTTENSVGWASKALRNEMVKDSVQTALFTTLSDEEVERIEKLQQTDRAQLAEILNKKIETSPYTRSSN